MSSPAQPALYAILIGIDNYPKLPNPRPRAVPNVEVLKKALSTHPQISLQADIKTLTNQEATKENICKALSSHIVAFPGYTAVLFYFSGFGYQADSDPTAGLRSVDIDGQSCISDKTFIELLERIGQPRGGNVVAFLDCPTRGFTWGNRSCCVVVAPELATETQDGMTFTKSLIDVLESERLDGLTIRTLAAKMGTLMNTTVPCYGHRVDRAIFNPLGKGASQAFIQGRTQKDGSIVLPAGSAHGIQADAMFGVHSSNVPQEWNVRLGCLMVECVEDLDTILEGGTFELPSIFFAVELNTDRGIIDIFLPDGTVEPLESILEWRKVESPEDADVTLGYMQDGFSLSWNGIPIDPEHIMAEEDKEAADISPEWMLRNLLRRCRQFKSHVGRSNPNGAFITQGLQLQLIEVGSTGEQIQVVADENLLSDCSAEMLVKERAHRGPFRLTLRNNNGFPIWPWVFLCIGESLSIECWHKPQAESPLGPGGLITVPHDSTEGLGTIEWLQRNALSFHIKIFATTEYQSFSFIQQELPLYLEDNLRKFEPTKNGELGFHATEKTDPRHTSGRVHGQGTKWAAVRLTIKVKYEAETESNVEESGRGTTLTEKNGANERAEIPLEEEGDNNDHIS